MDILGTYKIIIFNYKMLIWIYIGLGAIIGSICIDEICDYIFFNYWDSKNSVEKFIYRVHKDFWFKAFIFIFITIFWPLVLAYYFIDWS